MANNITPFHYCNSKPIMKIIGFSRASQYFPLT